MCGGGAGFVGGLAGFGWLTDIMEDSRFLLVENLAVPTGILGFLRVTLGLAYAGYKIAKCFDKKTIPLEQELEKNFPELTPVNNKYKHVISK